MCLDGMHTLSELNFSLQREQKDDEAHGQSEVRPTEIRKSMIVQLSEFPMKDTMVHVIGRQRATPGTLSSIFIMLTFAVFFFENPVCSDG